MNSLAIAIVVWNNADDAIECANSLLMQSMVDSMEILFVDNDSKPEAVTQLQTYITSQKNKIIHFVETGHNGGTAGGFTAAARWALENNVEYIGALNADAVADKNWCESLKRELDSHPEVGLVTSRVLHRDGKTVDSTGDFYTIWGLPSPRDRDQATEQAETQAGPIFGVTGGCYLARTKIYEDVGFYDPAMFMYYEDVDFSFRAQLAGFQARYTPDAIVYHKRGASSDTVPGLAIYNTFKNLPILFTKNVPLSLWPTIYPRFILMYFLILGNAIKNGKAGPALKGFLMSWRYIPHMFKERWKIQKNKKVTTEYINSIILHDIPPEQKGLRKFRKLFTGRA